MTYNELLRASVKHQQQQAEPFNVKVRGQCVKRCGTHKVLRPVLLFLPAVLLIVSEKVIKLEM